MSENLELGPELDCSGHSTIDSWSFLSEVKPTATKYSKRSSLNEEDLLNLLHGSDPVKIEFTRLENELTNKNRELSEAQCEIKALRLMERVKERALAEVTKELGKMVVKFQASEAVLENKNLGIKRVADEKKAALAAQFAAEATLRRVHAAQKDEELPPLEAILSPLESEIKLLKQEISKLQDDNRTLERLTKTKEAALLGAERDVQLANLKASLVDDVQNRNQELMKQIEMSQEEYKILDKMHRQKTAEAEKLGQTVRELEEAVLAGVVAANAVRDYQRQVSELKGEKRTLERTLSCAKVKENRSAVLVANEWKEANEKFIPVKHWLEERQVLMGEMQQLRDKLSIAERAVRSEARLKEKFQLRLKVIEDALKSLPHSALASELRNSSNGIARCHSMDGGEISSMLISGGIATRKSPAHHSRALTLSSPPCTILKDVKGVSNSLDGGRSLDEDQCIIKTFGELYHKKGMGDKVVGLSTSSSTSIDTADEDSTDGKQLGPAETVANDYVPGVFL